MSRQLLHGCYACATVHFVKPSEIREYFAKVGKKGGKARAAKLTKEEQRDIGRKAALARWAKEKRKQE